MGLISFETLDLPGEIHLVGGQDTKRQSSAKSGTRAYLESEEPAPLYALMPVAGAWLGLDTAVSDITAPSGIQLSLATIHLGWDIL